LLDHFCNLAGYLVWQDVRYPNIQTTRQVPPSSSKTWMEALWCVNGAPRADHEWRKV
jgi:hypothetical protein